MSIKEIADKWATEKGGSSNLYSHILHSNSPANLETTIFEIAKLYALDKLEEAANLPGVAKAQIVDIFKIKLD